MLLLLLSLILLPACMHNNNDMLLLITIDRCSAKAQPNSTVIAGTTELYVRQANNNVSQKSIGKDANVIYTYNQKQPGRGCGALDGQF